MNHPPQPTIPPFTLSPLTGLSLVLLFLLFPLSCGPDSPKCKPGQRRCEGNVAIVCSSQGDRWLPRTCPAEQTCRQGLCEDKSPPCLDGERRCLANNYEICVDGQWQFQTCPPGQICMGQGSCQQGACTHGQTRCIGTNREICQQGSWKRTPCPPGQSCQSGACRNPSTPSCQDGSRRCLDAVHFELCQKGQWLKQACPPKQTCEFGLCAANTSCQEGMRRCKDSSTAQICQNNTWKSSPCQKGQTCQSGACQNPPPTCQEGARRCQDSSTLQICQNNTWKSSSCQKGQTCQKGACHSPPQCTDGEKQCLSATTYRLCQKGSWQNHSCPQGQTCQKGSCQNTPPPVCNAGERRCQGNSVQICQNNAWVPQQNCSSGQICQQGSCQPWPTSYRAISVPPPPTDRPADKHADLNVKLRGWKEVNETKAIIHCNGPTDAKAPKLQPMFNNTTPSIHKVYKVGNWDWSTNSRSGWAQTPWPVQMVGFTTKPGQILYVPNSGYRIDAGGEQCLVLYADADSITLKYTREDNIVRGYGIHIHGIRVAPSLLNLYNSLNQQGRSSLPALKGGQAIGTAIHTETRLSIRDTGAFMDPRCRKDWW